MNHSRVAITGATGFVGRHLCANLRERGISVVAIARAASKVRPLQQLGVEVRHAELSDVLGLQTALADCSSVFHLAGAVDFGADWPRFHQVNVVGTANVLAAGRSVGVRRFVHCSSIVAVGARRAPESLNENSTWNLGPLCVPYVSTKRKAEELALAANSSHFQVVVVNPACVIGPDDDGTSEFGTLCQRFWKGRLPIHFGGGNNFVDVRDVAAGMVAAWQRGRPGERYILGGANRSMTAFFGELAKAADQAIPRLRLPSMFGPVVALAEQTLSSGRRARAYLSPAQARLLPWFFYYDNAKATSELKWRTRSLSVTLADTFADWRKRRAA
jgi:dihydroflavonol-4-reductase